jgi:hypothetical protein
MSNPDLKQKIEATIYDFNLNNMPARRTAARIMQLISELLQSPEFLAEHDLIKKPVRCDKCEGRGFYKTWDGPPYTDFFAKKEPCECRDNPQSMYNFLNKPDKSYMETCDEVMEVVEEDLKNHNHF